MNFNTYFTPPVSRRKPLSKYEFLNTCTDEAVKKNHKQALWGIWGACLLLGVAVFCAAMTIIQSHDFNQTFSSSLFMIKMFYRVLPTFLPLFILLITTYFYKNNLFFSVVTIFHFISQTAFSIQQYSSIALRISSTGFTAFFCLFLVAQVLSFALVVLVAFRLRSIDRAYQAATAQDYIDSFCSNCNTPNHTNSTICATCNLPTTLPNCFTRKRFIATTNNTTVIKKHREALCAAGMLSLMVILYVSTKMSLWHSSNWATTSDAFASVLLSFLSFFIYPACSLAFWIDYSLKSMGLSIIATFYQVVLFCVDISLTFDSIAFSKLEFTGYLSLILFCMTLALALIASFWFIACFQKINRLYCHQKRLIAKRFPSIDRQFKLGFLRFFIS